ncbi:cell wall hydrolase [Sphingomonas sp.]|uniref:cell wall hydrolase n=1 Tax=Sphingomonas sp. TaxID=28214 RepID=UPI0035BC29E7
MKAPRISFRLLRRLVWTWIAAVGVALAITVAMSAHAALRAIAAQQARAVVPAPSLATGYDADDHFPGAALLYADREDTGADRATAAPATGVTGTIALPALPLPPAAAVAAMAADIGIVPAAPFALAGASALDRGRALECLSAAIYYEAASEPDAGQAAVAQVVLNRVRHPAFPATVCGVVYQGSERAGCQFSFACDGATARVPARSAWARAARAAGAALAGYVYAPVGLATHYHTYAVTPAWNRSLVMTDVVGAHFFHRWKGYWGTAAAFRQRYRGGEPLPGPHPGVATPLVPTAVAIAVPLVTPPATIRAPYAATGTPRDRPIRTDALPAASQVLDRWKDSGQPLR